MHEAAEGVSMLRDGMILLGFGLGFVAALVAVPGPCAAHRMASPLGLSPAGSDPCKG